MQAPNEDQQPPADAKKSAWWRPRFSQFSLPVKFYLALVPLLIMGAVVIGVVHHSLRSNARELIAARQVKDLLTTPNDALFGVIDSTVLNALTSLEPELIEPRDRAKMERALDLSVWLDLFRPQIVV